MPKKRKIEASVAQLTQDGSFVYPWVVKETLEISFSPTFSTCYYGDLVLEKIKSGPNKGNYRGVENREVYRIWQHKYKMKFKIGNRVRLNAFNGTLAPDDNCLPQENYWRLIGCPGKIVKDVNSRSRLLVQFENDISALGLECHNETENSLWILETDLEEI